MGKVYLVQSVSVFEGEDVVTTTVFSTLEKAINNFEEVVKEIMSNDHLVLDTDEESLVIEKDKTSIWVYRDGEYADDHIRVWIEEASIN